MPFGDPVDLGKVPSIITEDAHMVTTLGGGYRYLILHMDSGWLMICCGLLVSKLERRQFHLSPRPCLASALQNHPVTANTTLRSLSDRPQALSWSCSSSALAVGLVVSVAPREQIPPGIVVVSNSHSITL